MQAVIGHSAHDTGHGPGEGIVSHDRIQAEIRVDLGIGRDGSVCIGPAEVVTFESKTPCLSAEAVGDIATVDIEGDCGAAGHDLKAGTGGITVEEQTIINGLEASGSITVGHQVNIEDEQGAVDNVIGPDVVEGVIGNGDISRIDRNIVPGRGSDIGDTRWEDHVEGGLGIGPTPVVVAVMGDPDLVGEGVPTWACFQVNLADGGRLGERTFGIAP